MRLSYEEDGVGSVFFGWDAGAVYKVRVYASYFKRWKAGQCSFCFSVARWHCKYTQYQQTTSVKIPSNLKFAS